MRFVFLLIVAFAAGPTSAQDQTAVQDFTNIEVKSFSPAKEPTGFVIGGRNETSLIRGLTDIYDRKISDLEKDMRPGAYATKGFLGNEERLLDVLVEDN